MFDALRMHWEEFRKAEPGSRFIAQHERRNHRHASTAGRVARLSLGVVITAAGLIAMPAPGPGMLIVVLGLSLLAHESSQVARFLDWAELKLRPLAAWGLRAWRGLPLIAKIAVCLLGLVLGAAAMFLSWHLMSD